MVIMNRHVRIVRRHQFGLGPGRSTMVMAVTLENRGEANRNRACHYGVGAHQHQGSAET
ncbi:hypothetical protein MycrhDRAFT_2452 [Mycolicibacterium rhodesiae JS60]|nr:hypothetical protein MycrhDRAFT_2452 [Mycolicibacterium rhodesiae JS60]